MVMHTAQVKAVNFENIPQELKDIPNWLMWKAERTSKGDYTKKPYSTRQALENGIEKPARWSDKNIWMTFTEVVEAYQTGNYTGIGFMLSNDNDIYALDIDGTTKHDLFTFFKDSTYCEFSPSGNGIHAYFKADKPKAFNPKPEGELELYAQDRFITITGHKCSTVGEIEEHNDTADYIIDQHFKKTEKEAPAVANNPELAEKVGKSSLTPSEVVQKATKDSRRGKDIELILNGDWESATDSKGNGFPSQSEADQSLMNTLAFYSAGDTAVMYEAWCNSNAYRKEKDHVNGGIGKTIEKAVSSLTSVYDPNYRSELNYTININNMLSGEALKKKLFEIRKQEKENMLAVWEAEGKNGRKPSVISPLRCAYLLSEQIPFILFDMEENTKLAMYLPNEGIYTRNEDHIKRIISWLEPHHNEQKAKEIIYHIKNQANVKEKTNVRHLIPVKNGVFNLKTKKLEPFSPEYVFTTKINTDYVENPEKPVIDGWDIEEWLEEIACNDSEIKHLLWQVINDSLNGNYTRKKAIFLKGFGNNGKGTFQELLTNLIGSHNVASLKVNEFDKPFRLSVLEGKTAVIGDDVQAGVYVDESSNFNSVATGDRVSVEFKNKQPYETYFRCTVIQSTNEMPRFKNKTEGTLRRVLIVPFNADFNGKKENFKIKEEYIKDEKVLQYVLYKAINMDFERFDIPKASQLELETFKADNDPVYEFKVNVFDEWNAPKIPKYMVYGFYKHFCEVNGYKPLSERKFHKELKMHLGKEWNTDTTARFNWEDLIKHVGDLDRNNINVEFPVQKKTYKSYENTRLSIVN